MGLEKIQHTIQYIEEHYNRELSIQKLEQLSHYSYRNIQRVFKNIFKESIGAFQKRLKLEHAYKKLIYTHDPITDIAYWVGFDSLQSFSKSFKKQFNISPAKARQERETVFESFIRDYRGEHEPITYELVYQRAVKVFYIGIHTKNYMNADIDLLWDRIDAIVDQDKTMACFGIIVDQPLITDKLKCRYEAGIDKDPLNDDFVAGEILGGRYARYIHKGNYSTIEDTYRRIYKDWLFHPALEFESTPIIEHYVSHASNTENEDDYITEILIPVKKK